MQNERDTARSSPVLESGLAVLCPGATRLAEPGSFPGPFNNLVNQYNKKY